MRPIDRRLRRAAHLVAWCALAATAAPCGAQHTVRTATVQGRVIDSLSQPVVGADVNVEGLTGFAVTTDSYGRFRLMGVPPGAHALSVRKIGYGPVDVAILTPRDSSLMPVVLVPGAVVLKTIVTRTVGLFGKPDRLAYTSKYDGFYERRAFNIGSGRFYTQEDIDRMDVQDFRDVLRRIPHLQVWDDGGATMLKFPNCGTDGIMIEYNGQRVWPARTQSGSADATIGPKGPSQVAAFAGNLPISQDDPLQAFRGMKASDVEAIEAYPTSSSLPAEAVGNACAAIFVWTK